MVRLPSLVSSKADVLILSFLPSRMTGKPVSVFLGGVLAMALVTLIGVVFGETLTRVVPVEYLEKGAALLFVAIGVLMWFEVF